MTQTNGQTNPHRPAGRTRKGNHVTLSLYIDCFHLFLFRFCYYNVVYYVWRWDETKRIFFIYSITKLYL